VSDCGILFVRNESGNASVNQKLRDILHVVKLINVFLLERDTMLTTSIAYGRFSYHERIEFPGIGKNPIYGFPYVKAFFDNENGRPKIQPGECRLLKEGLPDGFVPKDPLFRERRKHFYYYWNVQEAEKIDDFLKQYNNSYSLKYTGMLAALKNSL